MRLLLALALGLSLAGCGVDRGKCLKGETRTETVIVSFIQVGSTMMPIYGDQDVKVCFQWEYPEGKPE